MKFFRPSTVAFFASSSSGEQKLWRSSRRKGTHNGGATSAFHPPGHHLHFHGITAERWKYHKFHLMSRTKPFGWSTRRSKWKKFVFAKMSRAWKLILAARSVVVDLTIYLKCERFVDGEKRKTSAKICDAISFCCFETFCSDWCLKDYSTS